MTFNELYSLCLESTESDYFKTFQTEDELNHTLRNKFEFDQGK